MIKLAGLLCAILGCGALSLYFQTKLARFLLSGAFLLALGLMSLFVK
jgi:hypothetical protein